jgi:hypothetical protein
MFVTVKLKPSFASKRLAVVGEEVGRLPFHEVGCQVWHNPSGLVHVLIVDVDLFPLGSRVGPDCGEEPIKGATVVGIELITRFYQAVVKSCDVFDGSKKSEGLKKWFRIVGAWPWESGSVVIWINRDLPSSRFVVMNGAALYPSSPSARNASRPGAPYMRSTLSSVPSTPA